MLRGGQLPDRRLAKSELTAKVCSPEQLSRWVIDLAKSVVAEPRSIDSFGARGFEAAIYKAVRTRRGVGGALKELLWASSQGGVRILCKVI